MNLAGALPAICPAPGGSIDWQAVECFLEPILPVATLAATPQDPRFHAEGDVWAHTRLALEALVAGEPYAAAAPEERAVLFAAVLLHDAGKPAATVREEDGRLTSRGHAARGAALLRPALWRAGVPFGVREHLCMLVRHHQLPFHGLSRERAEAERLALRTSHLTRNDLLCAVADADARGRRCEEPRDREELVQEVELWREHCAEAGVLSAPYPFPSDHTRVVYFAAPGERRRPPGVEAYDDCRVEVVVMAGLPGSGKDHWLRRNRPGLPVVSLDALRAELGVDPADGQGRVVAAARERARVHLRAPEPFAWNATNVGPEVRGSVIALLREYGARVHVVYCEASAQEQSARNQARGAAVPAGAVERMLARWTVPSPVEAHRVTYVVDRDPASPTWPPPPVP